MYPAKIRLFSFSCVAHLCCISLLSFYRSGFFNSQGFTYKKFKFSLQRCGGNGTMPFLQQMKGLRRNKDAMKTAAGITIIPF